MRLLTSNCVEFPLEPRWRAGLFLSLAALATLLGSTESIRVAAATAIAKSVQAPELRKALGWDPDNAALHSRLAQTEGGSIEASEVAEAIRHARRATELAPEKSDYWMTLASACEAGGNKDCAGQALERSLALSPMTPQVWWVAANHDLSSGRADAALACFHRLLDLSPDYAEPAFSLALRAYGDPNLILDRVVSGSRDSRLALAFADFLSARDQFDAAHRAWEQAAGGNMGFPFADVQPYLERLLSHCRYSEAQGVWRNLEARGVIAQPAGSTADNLVFNGGFEQLPLEAGFDWRSQPSEIASVDFADAASYEGARCLRIDFPVGRNDEFEPVSEILPLGSGKTYRIAAYVRSRDITSDSGPRLRVVDADCPRCLDVATDAAVGTTGWHPVSLRFTTGPQTRAVRVSVWRTRSRVFPMEISGSFWLDSVSLRAEPQ